MGWVIGFLVAWAIIKRVANKPPRRVVMPVEKPVVKKTVVKPIKREPSVKEQQAKEDINFLLTRYIPNLDARLDLAQGELAASNNISKQKTLMREINTLENQIRNAEKRLAKAREVVNG